MSHQSKLKELQSVWYKKLKDEGFKDIEREDQTLSSWASDLYEYKNHSVVNKATVGFSNSLKIKDRIKVHEARAEYYYLAEHFFNSHDFNDLIDKAIWALHSEGKSCREIAKLLRVRTKKKLNKDNINSVIKNLSAIMMDEVKKRNQ